MPGLIESPDLGYLGPLVAPVWGGEDFNPSDLLAWPGLVISPDQVQTKAGAVARLEMGPKGHFGLSHTEFGRTVRLTSAIDPAAEDRALVDRLNPVSAQGVLCLGLGLAYQLEELALRLEPSCPIWVWESRPELVACALLNRDLTHLFQRPGFRLYVGPFDGWPWGEDEAVPTQILWRPATARHFASEYPGLTPLEFRPRPRCGISRVLLFQSGYFLDRELQNAAEELGLTTATWNFQRGDLAQGDNFSELLGLIKSFRPELVLTVNHLGFDAEGLMDDLFSRLKLRVASWFVDSPPFILGSARPSPYVRAFSWDRDYLPWLRNHGFERPHYLPLATDASFFRPSPHPVQASRSVVFVGDSLTSATVKYLAKLGLSADSPLFDHFLETVDRLAAEFLINSELLPDCGPLPDLIRHFGLPDQPETISHLQALITWRSSRAWRLKVLASFPLQALTVAGDHNWRELLNLAPGHWQPALDYYTELSAFYQTGQVNLNLTSAQMKTGLNQRVFDVPAAGGFLLTDHREQLEGLFEPGLEVVTFDQPEEAWDLAAWYAHRPQLRRKIVEAARRRVLNGHLYRHRLGELIREMES